MDPVPVQPVVPPLRPEVLPAEPEESPASRLARSFVSMLVGESRADEAERLAAAGWSVGKTVTAPVRRLLEPAVERRVPAAQDAAVALVELVRQVTQETIDIIDINAVLEHVDLNAVLARIDVNELMARIDLDVLLERIDLNELMAEVDIAAMLDRVDLNLLMEKIDLNQVLDKVDLNLVLEKVDLNEVLARIDIEQLVANTEIGSLIAQSTSSIATDALDAVRGRRWAGTSWSAASAIGSCAARNPARPDPNCSSTIRSHDYFNRANRDSAHASLVGRYTGAVSRFLSYPIDVIVSGALFRFAARRSPLSSTTCSTRTSPTTTVRAGP